LPLPPSARPARGGGGGVFKCVSTYSTNRTTLDSFGVPEIAPGCEM
jgi:hypothetical protein